MKSLTIKIKYKEEIYNLVLSDNIDFYLQKDFFHSLTLLLLCK